MCIVLKKVLTEKKNNEWKVVSSGGARMRMCKVAPSPSAFPCLILLCILCDEAAEVGVEEVKPMNEPSLKVRTLLTVLEDSLGRCLRRAACFLVTGSHYFV